MPLVFENPIAPAWPPQWNCDAAGQPKEGRAWRGGKIIVGRNDNSVNVESLATKKGPAVGPKALSGGFDIFTMASQNQPQQVLQILTTNNGSGGAMQPGAVAPGGLPGLPGAAPASGLPAAAPGGLPALPGAPPAAAAPAPAPAK